MCINTAILNPIINLLAMCVLKCFGTRSKFKSRSKLKFKITNFAI